MNFGPASLAVSRPRLFARTMLQHGIGTLQGRRLRYRALTHAQPASTCRRASLRKWLSCPPMSDVHLSPELRHATASRIGLLAVALAGLPGLGCDKATSKTERSGAPASDARPSPSGGSAADPAGCPKRVEQWRKRLTQLQREGTFIRPSDGIALAALAVPPTPPREAITLSMDASGKMMVDGVPRRTDMDLRDELKAKRKKLVEIKSALGGGAALDASMITLEYDRRTPWPKAARLVRVARNSGFSRAAFRFAAKSALRPPVASKARGQYEKRASGGAAGKVPVASPAPVKAEVLFRSCPSAQATMKELGTKPSADRPGQSRRLWEGLPKAFLECDCNVPWPALEAWVWAHFGRFRGVATTSTLLTVAEPGPSAPTVALPASATWSQAAPKVVSAAKGGTALRLRVAVAKP